MKRILPLLLTTLCVSATAQSPSIDDLQKRLDAAKKIEAVKQAGDQKKADAARQAEAQRRKAEAAMGTLIVKADRDCALSVNGEAKGQLVADHTTTVKVNAGEQLIECEAEGKRAESTERIPPGEQKVLRLTVPPPTRFDQISDGVRDKEQGIVWASRDNGSDVNWSQAQQYCQSLSGGWTLPTAAQLLSLYDESNEHWVKDNSHGSTFTINTKTSLIQFTGLLYWSSTQGPTIVGLKHGPGDTTNDHSVVIPLKYVDSVGGRALCVHLS